ncbi:DNA-binding domain-containing protein [uncultured Sunxiuqinia sp.]|uniref:DNA-binding domain-containing protein n=1 Tax=uncultured Sunxiuqinia sp. TaxID=1573825 RepID=UPI0026272950|nr:DNA-binding domain-containing protein [uncultured Sunxiuqinia sp.]
MALNYALFENHLTSDPGDYMAVTTNGTSLNQDDLVKLMLVRGSTLTETDILAVLKMEREVVCEQAAMGNHITTPLFNIGLSIKGVFHGLDDSYDPGRHMVRLNLAPGLELRQTASSISPQKVKAEKVRPVIEQFVDVSLNSVNEQVSSGGLARLRGSYLKYDPADPAQGIFFIDATNNETRVTVVSLNKPGELHFLVTQLAPGEYQVEVRTILKGHKEISSGRLEPMLSLAS